jgi:hypothetical protein
MRSLFYLIALVLILAWSIGFIGYGMGGVIHILLVFAVISVGLRVLLEKKFAH